MAACRSRRYWATVNRKIELNPKDIAHGQTSEIRERNGHSFCTRACGGSHRSDLSVRLCGRGLRARRKRSVLMQAFMGHRSIANAVVYTAVAVRTDLVGHSCASLDQGAFVFVKSRHALR